MCRNDKYYYAYIYIYIYIHIAITQPRRRSVMFARSRDPANNTHSEELKSAQGSTARRTLFINDHVYAHVLRKGGGGHTHFV